MFISEQEGFGRYGIDPCATISDTPELCLSPREKLTRKSIRMT